MVEFSGMPKYILNHSPPFNVFMEYPCMHLHNLNDIIGMIFNININVEMFNSLLCCIQNDAFYITYIHTYEWQSAPW